MRDLMLIMWLVASAQVSSIYGSQSTRRLHRSSLISSVNESAIPDSTDRIQDQRVDSTTQSPPDASTSAPYVDDSGLHYPAGYKQNQKVESLPEGIVSRESHDVTEVSLTLYPHFVRVFAVEGEFFDPNEAELRWTGAVSYGAIISRNYVLWSGPMCKDCTFIVVIGGEGDLGRGGSRRRATPIPYIDVKINMTESKTLILFFFMEPIEFGSTVQPVQLPKSYERPKSGDRGVLVGPSVYRGGSVLNLSNQTVLDQQDCNDGINSSIKKWRYQIISPPHIRGSPRTDTTKVPAGSFCAVMNNESSTFLASDFSMLFIQGKLAGIGYHEIHVLLDREGAFDYLFQYDIAYYRDWIKNVTGV